MNENISHNFFIWEEKNSTEPQKNYENKNASETKDTTNDIQKNVENLHWKDITNPKERKKAYNKTYHQANKDKIKALNKAWRDSNRDKIKALKKAWRDSNKDKKKDLNKAWRDSNRDKIKAYNDSNKDKQKAYYKVNKDKIKLERKVYREANKDEIKLRYKAYYEANKDKIKEHNKAYRKVNKDKIKLQKKAYTNNRFKTDIQFKLSHNLRSRLNTALNGNYKSGSAVKNLGCTIEQLKQHLESKFQPEMSWDNWTTDGWHIDHIKPLASFDLTDKNQLLEACHYTNLQPMWAKDNLSKSDKIL
jgi:hypothetical protein